MLEMVLTAKYVAEVTPGIVESWRCMGEVKNLSSICVVDEQSVSVWPDHPNSAFD